MLPSHHDMKVIPNEAKQSPYKFKATCSCQWEALAMGEEEAQAYINQHLAAHPRRVKEEVV